MNNPTVWLYLIYLAISIALTVWVAQTLHKNGRIFLVDVFGGNEPMADSVNHLLVVGFYLVNLGYVSLALKTDVPPADTQQVIENLSGKVGVVLLVLGGMHALPRMVAASARLSGTRLPPLPIERSQKTLPRSAPLPTGPTTHPPQRRRRHLRRRKRLAHVPLRPPRLPRLVAAPRRSRVKAIGPTLVPADFA